MKKILKFVIPGVVAIAIAAGAIFSINNKDIISGYFPNYNYNNSNEKYVETEGILIDAKKDDDIWKNINPYHQTSIAENRDRVKYDSYSNILKDCSVDVYTYLGNKGMFIYAETDDPIINTTKDSPFNKTGFEFYICNANAKTKLGNVYEYTISADGFIKLRVRDKNFLGAETYITKPSLGVKRSTRLLENGGYAIETYIPYETVGIEENPKEIHMGTALIRLCDEIDNKDVVWELLGMNTNGVAPNNNTTFPIFDKSGYRPFAVGENFGTVNSNIVDLINDNGETPSLNTFNRGTVAAFMDMKAVKNLYFETTVKINDFNNIDDPRVGIILRGEKKKDNTYDQVYFMFELDKEATSKYTIKDILMLPSNSKAGNDWTKSQKYLVDSIAKDSTFKISILKDSDAFYFYVDDVLLCKRSGIKELANANVTPGVASWFTGATFSKYSVKMYDLNSVHKNKTEILIGDSNKTNINIDLTSEPKNVITTNTTANNQAIVNYIHEATRKFYATMHFKDFESYQDCKDGRIGYSLTSYYEGGYNRLFILLRGYKDHITNIDCYSIKDDDFGGLTWSAVKNVYSLKLNLSGENQFDVYREDDSLYVVINNNVIKCLKLSDYGLNKNMTVGMTAWKIKSTISDFKVLFDDELPKIESGLELTTNVFDNFISNEKFELKEGKISIYNTTHSLSEKTVNAPINATAIDKAYFISTIEKPTETSSKIDPRAGIALESLPDAEGNKGRIQLLLEYDLGKTEPKSFVILPSVYEAVDEKWTSDWENSKRISTLDDYNISDVNTLAISKEEKEFKYYINGIEVRGLTGNIVNNLKYFGATSKVKGLIMSQYTDANFKDYKLISDIPTFEDKIVVTPSNLTPTDKIYFEVDSSLKEYSKTLLVKQGVALMSEDSLTLNALLVEYNNANTPKDLAFVKATRPNKNSEFVFDFDNKVTYSIKSILDNKEFTLGIEKDGTKLNLFIDKVLIASRDEYKEDDKVVDALVEFNSTGTFDDSNYVKPDDIKDMFVADNHMKTINIDYLGQDKQVVAFTTANNQSVINFTNKATDKFFVRADIEHQGVINNAATDGRVGLVLTQEKDDEYTRIYILFKGLDKEGKISQVDCYALKNDSFGTDWVDCKSLGSITGTFNSTKNSIELYRNGNILYVSINGKLMKQIDLSTIAYPIDGNTTVGLTSWKSNAVFTNYEMRSSEDLTKLNNRYLLGGIYYSGISINTNYDKTNNTYTFIPNAQDSISTTTIAYGSAIVDINAEKEFLYETNVKVGDTDLEDECRAGIFVQTDEDEYKRISLLATYNKETGTFKNIGILPNNIGSSGTNWNLANQFNLTSLKNPKDIKLSIAKKGDTLYFYIDNVLLGSKKYEGIGVDTKLIFGTTSSKTAATYSNRKIILENLDETLSLMDNRYIADEYQTAKGITFNYDTLDKDVVTFNPTSNNTGIARINTVKDSTKLFASAHIKINSVATNANDGRIGFVLTNGDSSDYTRLFVGLKGLTDSKITNIDSLEYKNDSISPWDNDHVKSLGSYAIASPSSNEADLTIYRNGNNLYYYLNDSLVKTVTDLNTSCFGINGNTNIGLASWKVDGEFKDVIVQTGDDINTTRTITYHLNDGVNNIDNPSTFELGETVTLKDPTKESYGFDGWYFDSEFKNKVNAISTCENVDVYAKWIFGVYTVTFDANGGQVGTASKQVTKGQTYGDLPTPTRNNYTFDGWYIDNNKIESTTTVDIDESKTAIAKWTLNSTIITDKTQAKESYKLNSEASKDLYVETTLKVDEIRDSSWVRSGLRLGTDALNGIDLVVQYSNAGVLQTKLMTNIYTNGTESGSNYFAVDSIIDKVSSGIKIAIAKKGDVFYFYANDTLLASKTYDGYEADTQVNAYAYNKYAKSEFTSFSSGKDVDTFMASKSSMFVPYRYSGSSMTFDYTNQKNNTVYSHETNWTGAIINWNKDPQTIQQIETIIDLDQTSDSNARFTGIVLSNTSDKKLHVVLRTEASNGNRKLAVLDDSLNRISTFNSNQDLWLSNNSKSSFKLSIIRDGNALVIMVDDSIKYSGTLSNLCSDYDAETKLNAGLFVSRASSTYKNISYKTDNDVKTEFSITYELNDGENNIANPSKYNLGEEVTLANPSKDNYDFVGWYTKSDFAESAKVTKVGIYGDKTVYAKYTPKNYTISYTLNDGVVSAANPTTYNVETETFTLNNPTKDGYTFKGWSGTDLTGDENKTVTISKGSTGDRSYTANFTANKYTVSYDTNGGVEISSTKEVTYDSTYGDLPTPTKTGYTFVGWFTLATGGTEIKSDSKVTILENQTLYAHWLIQQLSITYELDGGVNDKTNPEKFNYGSTVTLADAFKVGRIFEGWYIDDEYKSKVTQVGGTDNVTVYAKFVNSYNSQNSSEDGKTTEEIAVTSLAKDFYAETEVVVNGWGNYGEDQIGLRIKNADMSQKRLSVLYGTNAGLAGIRYGTDGENTVLKGDTCQAYTVNTIKNTPATKIKLAIAKLGDYLYYYENDILMNKIKDESFASDIDAKVYVYSKGSVSSFTNIDASIEKEDVEKYIENKECTFDLTSGNQTKAFDVSTANVKAYNGLSNANYNVLNFREAASTKFVASAKFTYGTNGDSSFANRRIGLTLTDENGKHLYVLFQASSASNVDRIITYKTDSSSYTVNWTAVANKTGLTLSNTNTLKIIREDNILHVYANDAFIYDVNLTNAGLSGATKIGISTWKTDATITEYSVMINYKAISFNCNGIGGASQIIEDAGTTIELPTPKVDGFTFSGWYSEPELTNKYESTIMPSDDVTLYAKWSADVTSTSGSIVTLMANSTTYKNFSIEADLTPSAVANVWAQMGFVIRNASGTNAYFYFGNGSNTGTINFNGIYINKDTEKSGSQSGNLKGSASPNTTGTNKFKLVISNNTASMYVNGTLASTIDITRNPDLSNDGVYNVGLMSKGTTVKFENIKITEIK